MKFMAHWSIDQDKMLPVLETWTAMSKQQRADGGAGVKIIGRWHDLAGRTGVAIFETTDLAALHRYIGQWNPHMDCDLVPVLDDEESATVSKQILADSKA